MPPENPLADVAHVIQLSVAPVFLLTAVGTILSVLSTRLGRIVDRARVLLDRAESVTDAKRPALESELKTLIRRRKLVNTSVTASTVAALCVAAVIASAFWGFIVGWKVSSTVAGLFLSAMVFFMASLVLFLWEVLLAAASVHLERH